MNTTSYSLFPRHSGLSRLCMEDGSDFAARKSPQTVSTSRLSKSPWACQHLVEAYSRQFGFRSTSVTRVFSGSFVLAK